MSSKSALITGVTGQDGSYLSEYLLKKGYQVYGLVRRSSTVNFSRIRSVVDDIKLINADLLDQSSIMAAMEAAHPDEIYNLAAQSFVPTSWDQPLLTGEFTALGVTRMLESVRRVCPSARFYQASSSEMFGKVLEVPQSEKTPFYPRSPYGVAKVYGHWITVNYRESYGLFACSGILFNHESPRRGHEFVTRKITRTAARIAHGLQDQLEIGNLEAKRDWGFAGDYVKAMHAMLCQKQPDDYVVATGHTHTVQEFCELAFRVAGFDIRWEGEGLSRRGIDAKSGKTLVAVKKEYYRPSEVDLLVGNAEKATSALGWRPEVDFEGLVTLMTEHDLRQAGKIDE